MRVDVRPEMFRWARERARLSEEVLARRIPKLEAWERGDVRPTLKQIETFAKATHTPVGYLFLARRAEHLDALRRTRAVQHAAGLAESRDVAPAEIARLNPHVSLDGVIGGTFCPTDGFIKPMGLLTGYLDAARRLGVRVAFGANVADLSNVRARWIVNAAGAWAGAFGVAVTPLRRQVLPTVGAGALSPDDPMTIWVDDGFHFRLRDGRALLLWPGGAAPADPFDTSVDPAWMDRVESIARERVPGLAGVAVDRAGAWAGLYEMSPDGHAILGRMDRVVLVNGSSGHGVMHAPALGQLAAEIILDGRAHTLDVSPLRPSRFAEGCPVRGVELL